MFSAFGSVSQTDWDDQDDEEETDYSYQKMLLSLCDGVKWPEGMTVQKQLKRSFGKELLGTGDSELVRLALSKDLITKDQAKKLLGYAAEKRLSNVVPLLILKQSGEWTGGVCNV